MEIFAVERRWLTLTLALQQRIIMTVFPELSQPPLPQFGSFFPESLQSYFSYFIYIMWKLTEYVVTEMK